MQGDTTSAMVAAMAAFYRRISIGHVEAGLRTFDPTSPFPEEINRTVIGHVATHHFAPTEGARANLMRAEVDAGRITVTGNTVVDAVKLLAPQLGAREIDGLLPPSASAAAAAGRLILVTCHRRESFGEGIENICRALLELIRRSNDIEIVFPVHPNPNVRAPVGRLLGGAPRIHLLEPLAYLDLMTLVQRSALILTDSGGLQEEAPSFGKPVLILRDVTERPEVVAVGAARLVGTNVEAIVDQAMTLLSDQAAYADMAGAGNPFGDGRASERIVARICAG